MGSLGPGTGRAARIPAERGDRVTRVMLTESELLAVYAIVACHKAPGAPRLAARLREAMQEARPKEDQ